MRCFIRKCKKAGWLFNSTRVFQELEKFAKEIGHSQLLYTAIPDFYLPANNKHSPVFHTTYDSNWMNYYESRRYNLQDGALKHCLSGAETTYFWPRSFNIQRLSPVERRIFLEAGEAGLNHGFTLPMRNAFGALGVMSLTFEGSERDFEKFSVERQKFTEFYCYHFNESILNRTSLYFGSPHLPKLTPKELEVIKWLACGNTYDQVADRLKIGVSTIRKHTASVIRKFKARNTTHACALALRWGVLG